LLTYNLFYYGILYIIPPFAKRHRNFGGVLYSKIGLDRGRSLSRGEEDQDVEILGDRMKAVLNPGFDKNQAAGGDLSILLIDPDSAPAADNILYLWVQQIEKPVEL